MVERGTHIKARTADQDRPLPTGPDTGNVYAGFSLVCRDASFLTNIQNVELMVSDPPARLNRGLGRADVHAAIQLHGVGVDDLATQ
jgi:hypothetical protein